MDEVMSQDQAAAYLKLQDDVKKMIVETVAKALNDWDFNLRHAVVQTVVSAPEIENKIKLVIQNQMSK